MVVKFIRRGIRVSIIRKMALLNFHKILLKTYCVLFGVVYNNCKLLV